MLHVEPSQPPKPATNANTQNLRYAPPRPISTLRAAPPRPVQAHAAAPPQEAPELLYQPRSWTPSRILILACFGLNLLAGLIVTNWNVRTLVNDVGPVLGLSLIFVALLVFLNRPWVHLVAGITVALLPLVGLLLFGGLFDLHVPIRGNESVTTYILLLSLLLVIPAAITGFRHGRAWRTRRRPPAGWRSAQGRYALTITLLFLGIIATSALAGHAVRNSNTVGYDFTAAASVRVDIRNFHFEPKNIRIQANQITEIVVANWDTAFHTFTYVKNGVEYNHDVNGLSTLKFLVLFDSAGTIAYRCVPHSSNYEDKDGNMVGSITVT